MLSRLAAQGLTDGLAAAALFACVLSALRRGVRSALELRLMFAFGGLCLFFVFRGAAEIFDRPALTLVAELTACLLPVAGLALVEGVLRRHAPWGLKAAVTLGAAVLLTGLIVFGGGALVSRWGLGVYIILSLLAFTGLLLTRDRTSLSHQENASIDALMLAGAGLMMLSLADFLPAAPLGMSGVGAALLALFTRSNLSSTRGVQSAFIDILLIAVAAALFGLGLAHAVALASGPEVVRLGVVALTGAAALTTALGALHERAGHDDARALRRAMAEADTSSLPAFLDGLSDQPLLRGLQVADGGLLADYDVDMLAETASSRAVWTRQALGDPEPAGHDRGREELADLMFRTDASHAALISVSPLRIALLTLPEIGPADDAEIDLAVFRKLAAIAAEAHA